MEKVLNARTLHRTPMECRRRRSLTVPKLLEQKLMGMVLLLICTAVTILDDDATAAVLFGPLGLWMLCTKNIVIC